MFVVHRSFRKRIARANEVGKQRAEIFSFRRDCSTRNKLILAGLYLSKFDEKALSSLGFETFTEAFNAIGLALQARPAAVKTTGTNLTPIFRTVDSDGTNVKCAQFVAKFTRLTEI